MRRRAQWWWRHSLWMVWTFSLGFLNWLSFFYIGLRARYTPWLLWGFVYLLPLLITVAALGTPYVTAALSFQLFMSAVSLVHAGLVRPRYRALMFGAPPAAEPTPPFLWTPADRPALPRGVDGAVVEVLGEAQAALDEINATVQGVAKPEVRTRTAELCRTAERIIDELRRRPQQVPLARAFLAYYLDAATRILRGYAELSRSGVDTAEMRETLEQAEASLLGIQKAFDSQLEALAQQRQLDLDTEIALLERTMEADNLLGLPAREAPKQLERKGSA